MNNRNLGSVVLFDGVCYLCDGSVRFIVRHDHAHCFRFAQMQSRAGRALMQRYGVNPDDLSSFLLLEDGEVFRKSEAWLRIISALGWPWRMVSVLRLIPRFVRDAIYDWVGRHRYQWFGRAEQCLVPGPEMHDRFLDDEDNE